MTTTDKVADLLAGKQNLETVLPVLERVESLRQRGMKPAKGFGIQTDPLKSPSNQSSQLFVSSGSRSV